MIRVVYSTDLSYSIVVLDMSRPYDELKESYQMLMGPDQTQWSVLSQKQLLGEAICTAKPMAHCILLLYCTTIFRYSM